jgi:hypothetical protein
MLLQVCQLDGSLSRGSTKADNDTKIEALGKFLKEAQDFISKSDREMKFLED